MPGGGPGHGRPRAFTTDNVLSDEDVEAAIAVLKRSADEDTQLLLLTVPLFTRSFQEHLHVFEVRRSMPDFIAFCVDNLPYNRPFDIQMSYGVNDTALFVVPYCFFWVSIKSKL